MLLDAAAYAGEVSIDVAPFDLLRAIGSLAFATGAGAAHIELMMLLLDGLDYGAAMPK